MTYMRMAKSLIKYDFPGYYTKMFGDMVSTQIQQAHRFQTSSMDLIKLWIDCISKLDNWNKDRNALHVLDVLAKYCFTREEWHECFMEHYASVYKVNFLKVSFTNVMIGEQWTDSLMMLSVISFRNCPQQHNLESHHFYFLGPVKPKRLSLLHFIHRPHISLSEF